MHIVVKSAIGKCVMYICLLDLCITICYVSKNMVIRSATGEVHTKNTYITAVNFVKLLM